MATIMKKLAYASILPIISIQLTSLCMDLSPKIPKSQKLIIQDTLCIHANPPTALYVSKKYLDGLSIQYNRKGSQSEPFLLVNLKQPNGGDVVFFIPASNLFNQDNNSTIELSFNEVHAYANNKIHTYAKCTTNPLLPGKSFNEQFSNHMENFYKQPFLYGTCIQELTTDGVIVNESNHVHAAPNMPGHIINSFVHGPNGCPNQEKFIALMAAKKTKHHNNSSFNFVMNRQIGARVAPRNPNPTIIDLDLILNNSLEDILSTERMNKAALDADEKLLSDCYNDFMVQEKIKKELSNKCILL